MLFGVYFNALNKRPLRIHGGLLFDGALIFLPRFTTRKYLPDFLSIFALLNEITAVIR